MPVRPQYIVLHHSATPDGIVNDWDALRRFHTSWRYQGRIITPEEGQSLLDQGTPGVLKPWRDIAYHRGFERLGTALVQREGRVIGEPGAHCAEMNMNVRSIGYCVVGNFDLAPPNIEIFKFVAEAARRDCQAYGIPTNAVIGHRDAGLMAGFDWRRGQYKSCPGKYFLLDAFRELIGP